MSLFQPAPERLILEAMRNSISSTPMNLEPWFALLADDFHFTVSTSWNEETITLASKQAAVDCIHFVQSFFRDESEASTNATCDARIADFFLRMHARFVDLDFSRVSPSHSVVFSDNTTFIDECVLGALRALKTYEFKDDKLVSVKMLLEVSSDVWYIQIYSFTLLHA
jgi:hypothetical protein